MASLSRTLAASGETWAIICVGLSVDRIPWGVMAFVRALRPTAGSTGGLDGRTDGGVLAQDDALERARYGGAQRDHVADTLVRHVGCAVVSQKKRNSPTSHDHGDDGDLALVREVVRHALQIVPELGIEPIGDDPLYDRGSPLPRSSKQARELEGHAEGQPPPRSWSPRRALPPRPPG